MAAQSSWRSIWTVGWHELADSIRSRRAIVLLVLYFAGAMAGTWIFIKVLHAIENQLETVAGIAATKQAGGTTSVLWKNKEFREIITHLTGDKETANQLLNSPPLGLFFGWLSFTFAPVLVMLMSAGRVSEEIWSGSVRFVAFRTSRFAWCLGKYWGQAMQLLAALLLSAAGAWLIGWWRLALFEPLPNALAVSIFAVKAWIYALAYLGLAIGISQVIASPNLATGIGFFALVAVSILSAVAHHWVGPGWARLWDLASLLTPGGHQMDLWLPNLAHVVPAAVFVVTLGFAYMLAGFISFSRRDL